MNAVLGTNVSTRWYCAVLLFLIGFLPAKVQGKEDRDRSKRPVTVGDMIEMARIGGPFPDSQYSPKRDFAVYSPNGKYFVFVVRKGNLQDNTNSSSLLLCHTGQPHLRPVVLASMRSSSNQAGIARLSWSEESDTVYFLGSDQGQPTQMYSVQLGSRRVVRHTNHPTSLLSYAVSAKGKTIAFMAEKPTQAVLDEAVRRNGFIVGQQRLPDLLQGRIGTDALDIFVQHANRSTQVTTEAPVDSGIDDLFLSPDGTYLVYKSSTPKAPSEWRAYTDAAIQDAFQRSAEWSILHYELVNTRSGKSELLIPAPASYHYAEVLWSPDSRTLIIGGGYLPLNVTDSAELERRAKNKFVIEVRLKPRTIEEVGAGDLLPIRWDPKADMVEFRAEMGKSASATQDRFYQKTKAGWRAISQDSLAESSILPNIIAQQGINSPPTVAMQVRNSTSYVQLLDLNPSFERLWFGHVEQVQWKDGEGRRVDAGLYYPPDYTPGKRYPLVIQTHGFDPEAFSLEGYYPTAFAAQVLAGKGFVVLQINDIFYDLLEAPEEARRVMSIYENGIDYLDKRGLIDRSRVGIVGFSRTCLYVAYALTHAKFPYAAAVIVDGIDGSLFQYLAFANSNRVFTRDEELANGGRMPFGDGLPAWIKNSPSFSIDKVSTQLLVQAIGPSSLLLEWEWFAALTRLGKPVDFAYLPDGTHLLAKPWERRVSEQMSVDWFCFWLQNQQAIDPSKVQQGRRWEYLRSHAAQSDSTGK